MDKKGKELLEEMRELFTLAFLVIYPLRKHAPGDVRKLEDSLWRIYEIVIELVAPEMLKRELKEAKLRRDKKLKMPPE